MTVLSHKECVKEHEASLFPPNIKITMHVVSPVRNDERILREASALGEEGLMVSVVDVETQGTCSADENMQGIRVKHVFMSREFAETRFTKHGIVRALRLLLHSIMCLVMMPTDIYHAHDTIALPACAVAALIRRKPLVFDAHELPLAELRTRRQWLRNLVVYMLIAVIHFCAGVITVSPPIAEKIRTYYKAKKVTLVRNTPVYQTVEKNDRLRQHLRLGSETRIALYQGNIQGDRSLDILIRATAFFDPNIVLVLMGKDMRKTVAQLEALAIQEGVADRVKILPPVPYKELLEWTASADVGLIIYSPNYSLNVKFCLPNKLFEYMMAGLPILTTELDAVREVLTTYEVGRIVASLDAAEVGTAINTIVTKQEVLNRMHLNALDAAKQEFHWGKERYQLLHLYRDIIDSQKMS